MLRVLAMVRYLTMFTFSYLAPKLCDENILCTFIKVLKTIGSLYDSNFKYTSATDLICISKDIEGN